MFNHQATAARSRRAAKILIAEADHETRARYREGFNSAGYHVVEAADGAEALVKAFECDPSLVISEIRLPTIDGYGLCEVMRRDRATAEVPVVIVTTETDPASMMRATQAGATTILEKPADLKRLRHEVSMLLNGVKETSACDAPPHVPRTRMLNHVHERYQTTTPPNTPPPLRCQSCDAELEYQHSFVGGVSTKRPEQWDYFSCPTSCGTVQYRHRTRAIRFVE